MNTNKITNAIRDLDRLENDIELLIENTTLAPDSWLQVAKRVVADLCSAVVTIAAAAKGILELVLSKMGDKYTTMPKNAAEVTAFLKTLGEMIGIDSMKGGIFAIVVATAVAALVGIAAAETVRYFLREETRNKIRKELEWSLAGVRRTKRELTEMKADGKVFKGRLEVAIQTIGDIKSAYASDASVLNRLDGIERLSSSVSMGIAESISELYLDEDLPVICSSVFENPGFMVLDNCPESIELEAYIEENELEDAVLNEKQQAEFLAILNASYECAITKYLK